jgi:hypothetical protein
MIIKKSKVIIFYIILTKFKGHIDENSTFNVFVNLENRWRGLGSFRPGSFVYWVIESFFLRNSVLWIILVLIGVRKRNG